MAQLVSSRGPPAASALWRAVRSDVYRPLQCLCNRSCVACSTHNWVFFHTFRGTSLLVGLPSLAVVIGSRISHSSRHYHRSAKQEWDAKPGAPHSYSLGHCGSYWVFWQFRIWSVSRRFGRRITSDLVHSHCRDSCNLSHYVDYGQPVDTARLASITTGTDGAVGCDSFGVGNLCRYAAIICFYLCHSLNLWVGHYCFSSGLFERANDKQAMDRRVISLCFCLYIINLIRRLE